MPEILEERSSMVVVHLAASSFVGGPESQILGLVGQGRDRNRSAVLSFSEGGRCRPLLDAARSLGADVVELNHNAPNYRASAREIADHLARLGASVLCCHGYKPDLIGLVAARRAGVPVISVSHGWTGATLKVRLNEAADRLCLHGMDRVVCVSARQARRVRRVGVSSKKIAVIHNAVDASRYSTADPSARDELIGLFSDRPDWVVGAAGRLSPEKGFDVLLDAAARVTRENSRVGFVHFGDGPLRADLIRRAEALGLNGRFVFAGFRGDLPRLLGGLDLFALPSYTEGLPVVVLEAFASGVPVVATAVGGTPEVVEDGINGRLVSPGNPESLARRITEVLDEPHARRVFGARGRALVLDRFTFQVQALSYQRLFESLGAGQPALEVGA